MIIDAHVHLFTPRIVSNVAARSELVADLRLQSELAAQRLGPTALRSALHQAGVLAVLNLPTASAAGVRQANRAALATAEEWDFIKTAGTLHPACTDLCAELAMLHAAGVRAIKLCSFSQGFELDGPAALSMFAQIEAFNRQEKSPFFVVLDTFYRAAAHFDADPEHITEPAHISRLVQGFPGIFFVAAHMGGLTAPFEKIIRYLPAAENLYLETSNATHTLKEAEFIRLLRIHGPERILFGTDWPWFAPAEEIPLIRGLLQRAGFTGDDQAKVFGENIAQLLAL